MTDSNALTKKNYIHKVEGLTHGDQSVSVESLMGRNLTISAGIQKYKGMWLLDILFFMCHMLVHSMVMYHPAHTDSGL